MATLTLAPSGLKWARNRRASSPNYQLNRYLIRKGYGSPIARGDLVCTGTGANLGYIVPYAAGGGAVLGVFDGLDPYFDLSVQQVVNKVWYAGTENPTGDMSAMIIDDQDAVFVAQTVGGPVTVANRGQNIDLVGNGAPNVLGMSTAGLDFTTVANTATLPLRIIGLSQLAYPGVDPTLPGAPPTNNYVEVIFNSGANEFAAGTGV